MSFPSKAFLRPLHRNAQGELDDMLLALGLESAKNEALSEALRSAGINPEHIIAAVEDAYFSKQREVPQQ